MAATFSFTAVHYTAPKLHHHLHRPSSFISYPYRTTALPIVVSASAASSPSNPKHLSALIKPLAITITAASVLLFANLSKPSFSIPISHAVESDTLPSDNHSDEEVERILEERVDQNPDSLLDLNDLLEFKVKHQKFHDAASIVDQVEILTSNQGFEEDTQLRLLKLHFLIRAGELEKARNGFEEVLAKNPFYVDAYHGLLIIAEMSTDPEERRVETDNLLERIKINLERSKREKRKGDLDGFYLLMGHVKLREGKYDEAIEFFTKSAESEPRNFRPYLGRGTAYALMKKKAEAEKQFETCRRLLSECHVSAMDFKENMVIDFEDIMRAMKIFDNSDAEETPKKEKTASGR